MKKIAVLLLTGVLVMVALYAWGHAVAAAPTPPRIEVHADQPLGAISTLTYGFNHRYLDDGDGLWDAAAGQVYTQVLSRGLEIGLPVLRFPGGTASSTYHWTDGIGPPEERPTGISGFTGEPVTNTYGFDEQMLFVEQLGATSSVVVNFGSGTAQEAAAWVAYANGAVTDTTPIGVDGLGVDWGAVGDWAARREANQVRLGMTPHPYHIAYWEVGNELYGDWEFTWTHNPIEYGHGGTAWQSNQPVVRADDWQERASYSDGQPAQVFYVRYPPVVTGTQVITVAGTIWTEVADLSSAGPGDEVYEFDPRPGEIRFGDGTHGRIPPLDAPITATYQSGPHASFGDYYAAMKAVDPHIKVGSCHTSDEFLNFMGQDQPYDFLVKHLYYQVAGSDLAQAHLDTMAGAPSRQQDLQALRDRIALYAGPQAGQIEIAVTEYNLQARYAPTPHYGMSLDQGLYVADTLRTFIEEGIPLAHLHCLSCGDPAALGDAPQFLMRPAAYAFELYNRHLAPLRVTATVTPTPMLPNAIPALEVLASTETDGSRLTLLAINKDMTATITATVAISGFAPAPTATVWTLNGPSVAAFNDESHPTDVTLSEATIGGTAGEFVHAFPAHSVTLIELPAATTATQVIYLPLVLREADGSQPPVTPPGGSLTTYVPSSGIGDIAVRVTLPETARYSDGAGVVVEVATFLTSSGDFYTSGAWSPNTRPTPNRQTG